MSGQPTLVVLERVDQVLVVLLALPRLPGRASLPLLRRVELLLALRAPRAPHLEAREEHALVLVDSRGHLLARAEAQIALRLRARAQGLPRGARAKPTQAAEVGVAGVVLHGEVSAGALDLPRAVVCLESGAREEHRGEGAVADVVHHAELRNVLHLSQARRRAELRRAVSAEGGARVERVLPGALAKGLFLDANGEVWSAHPWSRAG